MWINIITFIRENQMVAQSKMNDNVLWGCNLGIKYRTIR